VRYLIASGMTSAHLPQGCRVVADGAMISFEQPWSFGAPLIARVEDTANLDALQSAPGVTAFVVEGIDEPGSGQAFAIGAHLMRDPEGFKPYAAAVPGVIKTFGCRYIARGGAVTPLAGSFVPDRAVLMEFSNADDAVAFYFSAAYAPLLKIRLKTTEPRFVVVARSGALPQSACAVAEKHLRIR
jgi:uncharacterized protein (DUF1330 family)